MNGGVHARAVVLGEELEEFGLLHKVQLARLARLSRRIVHGSTHSGVEAQYLTRLGNLEDEGLALARSCRQFHSALAENIDTPADLAFDKQSCPCRIGEGELYLLKGFHFGFRQATEEALRT